MPNPTGTISGMVTNSAGTPLEGRRVSAIDLTTEQHYDATTAKNGGYTIKVPPGTYRIEIELQGSERVAKAPDVTKVNKSDLDPHRDIVITGR